MRHFELKKDVGIRMRKIRKALGFTQNKMVSFFDIGRANYSRIEKGEIFPGAAILNTLRMKFEVSLDWLLTGNGQMLLPSTEITNKEKQNVINLGDYSDEVKEMLIYMEKVPMVKHAILGTFSEYRVKNKSLIDSMMDAANSKLEDQAS